MGIEHHRQRLSTALCMPKHATFSICGGGIFSGFDCFLYSVILMIGGKHLKCLLAIHIEADKVFKNVKKAVLFEYPFKESIKLGVLSILVITIFRFPLHKAIFAGSYSSCFRSSHITHHTECIIHEQARHFMHIVA